MSDVPDEEDSLDRLVGNVPATVTVSMDNFFLAKLAQELAMNIREPAETLAIYKISEAEWAVIQSNDFFKRAFDQYVIEWNSAKSTNDRLKIEAAVGLEAAMPSLSARMQSNNEDLGKAVEVAKLFSKISGVDAEPKGGGNPADKFSITINLGEDVKLKFEKDVEPTEPKVIEAVPIK